MYSVSEVIIIQILCFIIAFNSKTIVNCLFPFLNTKLEDFFDFITFICNNNPLILDYYDLSRDSLDNSAIKYENTTTEQNTIKQLDTKYEDKYLEKFKRFPNEYNLTELELEQEINEFEKIKTEYENKRLENISVTKSHLLKINNIQENGIIHDTDDKKWIKLNDFGKTNLLKYYDLVEIHQNDPDNIDFNKLYLDLLKDKEILLNTCDELEKETILDDELHSKARDIIINKKLDKFVNNYILEHTPLGNVYMRYNNDKKSFEYFSNNSIPYRYLEPIGRRYVMTYWCKPLFVEIEEELKKAEQRYDEDKKKKEDEEKQKEEERKKNPRKVLVQLKNYNKETKDQMLGQMKNRSNKNSVLPPQIKANLPDVNKVSEKQLIKENANRYTWEGRLSNFCPLQKIDKKELNKQLLMTYADFKKLQQEQQNKKSV